MIDFVQIVTVSLFAWLWSSKLTQVDMIFGWVPGLVDRNLPTVLKHPLYYCATCICGFWYGLYLVVSVSLGHIDIYVAANSLIWAMALTEMITRKFA